MQQAAAELRFETAGKIKAYIDELSQLGKGPYRHVGRLSDFQFVSFQRGPRPGSMKVFLICPGTITTAICVLGETFKPAEVMRVALETAAEGTADLDQPGVERIGIVSHHLFSAKNTHGVFLRLSHIDEKSIAKAYRDLQKQTVADESDDEGIVKEAAGDLSSLLHRKRRLFGVPQNRRYRQKSINHSPRPF